MTITLITTPAAGGGIARCVGTVGVSRHRGGHRFLIRGAIKPVGRQPYLPAYYSRPASHAAMANRGLARRAGNEPCFATETSRALMMVR